MSNLSFQLNFRTHQLNMLDLPVEVRKPNMTLVKRTLSSETVKGLKAGTYFVSARMPAGQELFSSIEVEEGTDTVAILAPEDDTKHETHGVGLFLGLPSSCTPQTQPAQATTLDSLEAEVDKIPLQQGKAPDAEPLGYAGFFGKDWLLAKDRPGPATDSFEGTALDDYIDFSPPSGGGPSGGRDVTPFEVAQTPFEVGMRLFSGDILQQCHLVPAPSLRLQQREEDIPGVAQIDLFSGNGVRLLQLLQAGRPALNVLLPMGKGMNCLVVVRRLSERQAASPPSATDAIDVPDQVSPQQFCTVDVHLQNMDANALLRYQAIGNLQQAATALNSHTISAERLLSEKQRDPFAAVVGAYSLLRFNELDRLHDWTQNLYQWFDLIPDGAAILGEHFARTGEHEKALDALLSLEERGLPIFTDGFSFAQNRLRLYIQVGAKHLEKSKVEAAKKLLEKLSRFAPFVDYSNMFLSFTGLQPNEPDEKVVSLEEFVTYGGSDPFLNLTEALL